MKTLLAILLAATSSAAFATVTSSVSHRIYDTTGGTFADDPAVQNATASGYASYYTDGASLGGNFGGATAYTQVDAGQGYLKAYSKITAADSRDGAQSLLNTSFTDRLTFDGTNSGMIRLTVRFNGAIDGQNTAQWPFAGNGSGTISGAGNNGFQSGQFYLNAALPGGSILPQNKCPTNGLYGLTAGPGGGQVTTYFACGTSNSYTPTTAPNTPLIQASQDYDKLLTLEFMAAPGDIVDFTMGFTVRNRLQPFIDELGNVDPNRGPAEIVADFSHTITLESFELANGLSMTAAAGPLVMHDGRLTYQAVADLADVPEPATLGMLGLGFAAVASRRRRH